MARRQRTVKPLTGWDHGMGIVTKAEYLAAGCFSPTNRKPGEFNVVNEDGELLTTHGSLPLAKRELAGRARSVRLGH